MNIKNNKGFAVSTLLYSLSIMGFLIITVLMSLMSVNRINTSSLVEQIELELNRYSLTETTFRPSETGMTAAQEFTVPTGESGYYKIELWGAAGGKSGASAEGGRGAYTSGTIYLKEWDVLYFFIGTKGQDYTDGLTEAPTGGFNGGSDGDLTTQTAGGGGATDLRIDDGGSPADALNTRIMVAAGGTGASAYRSGADGGTLYGLKVKGTKNGSTTVQPAIRGEAEQDVSIAMQYSSGQYGAGGGYTAGGVQESGSSFISGYGGVQSFTMNSTDGTTIQTDNTNLTYYPSDADGNIITTNPTTYFFINGQMHHGVQNGDGYAKIQKVSSSAPTKIHPTLKNYGQGTYTITDCVDNTLYKEAILNPDGTINKIENDTKETNGVWNEIQIINSQGRNILQEQSGSLSVSYTGGTATDPKKLIDGKLNTASTVTSTSETDMKCVTISGISVGANDSISEIVVVHRPGVFGNNTLTISQNGAAATTLISGSHEEYVTGTHISVYNPDITSNEIPNANYYIIPAAARWRTLETRAQTLDVSDPNKIKDLINADPTQVQAQAFSGNNYQKWHIEQVTPGKYKIVEIQDYKAMQISSGLYQDGQKVSAPYAYIGSNPEEHWTFEKSNTGRYKIYTANSAGTKMYLYYDNGGRINVKSAGTGSAYEFYLYNADY